MNKKLLLPILLLSLGTLVSCGEDNKPNDDPPATDETSYTFEAEYVDLTGISGGGISGAASGVDMIYEASNASNGFALGFLHKTDLTITFDITSDVAAEATMDLVLGNETQGYTLDPSMTFAIIVNDTNFEYTPFQLKPNKSQVGFDFIDYKVSPKINLKAGDNSIKFKILANDNLNGGTAGPIFDCMKLTSSAKLTWEPKTSNIE